MNSNYNPKITYESSDKYERARDDLIKARMSFIELNINDRQRLIKEMFGIEITVEMVTALQDHLGLF